MLIISNQKLDQTAKDEGHPMHAIWKEYEDGLAALRRKFPKEIVFRKRGFPRSAPGIYKDKEVMLAEETPIDKYPLKSEFSHPVRGKEIWACCLDTPKVLPGNLWDLGNKRTFDVGDSITVNTQTQPDFAYFLYYISKAVSGGTLYVYDPEGETRAKADDERAALDRKFAVWKQLDDDKTLRMAQWLGIPDADNQTADALKFEIEARLIENDKKAERDPSVRGTTKEFMNEMKPSDGARVRIFLRDALDNALVTWTPDGNYRVGDKVLIHIAKQDLERKFDKLCDFMSAAAHVEDLRNLMRDVMTKEYLDKLKDTADLRWIGKVMEIDGYYNKPEEQVKQAIYETFNLA